MKIYFFSHHTEESLVKMAETVPIECGYCLQQGDSLIDPRALPCGHVHCYPCLVGYFDTNRIVRCGKCREVFDVTLVRVPSADTEAMKPQQCDVCAVKGITVQPAVSYCTTCTRKMCTEHNQTHQDFHPEHQDVMDMEVYKERERKLQVRYCIKHGDNPLSMGCTSCNNLLCTTCIDSSHQCLDGSPHHVVTLDEKIRLLKSKMAEIKVETQTKEEKLSALLKQCTKKLSDYEIKTEEMIKLLHDTRDEQLAEIRIKYNDLEKDLTESRMRSRNEILEFMEREIGVRLTEINTLLSLQNLTFRDSHQVDVVSNFTEAANELRRFTDEKLPSLFLADCRKLKVKCQCRHIELKLVEDKAKPTSLRLNKKVKTGGDIYAVCSNQGVTYVGTDGSVYKIDESEFSLSTFISPIRDCEGIAVYRDKLYVLTDESPYEVHVYDLSGRLITSWNHTDSCNDRNKLTVTADMVVVPDRSNKRLTVYSLEGQLLKHIPYALDGNRGVTAICAADSESVIVSSTETSTVFRVNIDSGEVMWTCTQVNEPGGVTCYGDYILVTPLTTTQTEISILDISTGARLGKLVDAEVREKSKVYDLFVTGNTLLVPRYNQRSVLYYELLDD